jgi:hypothetical protein
MQLIITTSDKITTPHLQHNQGAVETSLVADVGLPRFGLCLQPSHTNPIPPIVLLFHLWEGHILPTHFVLTLPRLHKLHAVHVIHATCADPIAPPLDPRLYDSARNISLLMQIALTLYDDYHTLCVNTRAQDMRFAALYCDAMFSFRNPWAGKYLVERVAFLTTDAVYGAIPVVHAHVCQFLVG